VKKNKLLTERQVALYRYLLKQDKFKNLKEIIVETDLYGSLENYEFNNTNQRRQLTKDIRALKASDNIFGVILSTTKGIKIATKEEYEHYFERQSIKQKKAMKLLNKQREKAKKHYQTKMDFETGLNENYVVAFRE